MIAEEEVTKDDRVDEYYYQHGRIEGEHFRSPETQGVSVKIALQGTIGDTRYLNHGRQHDLFTTFKKIPGEISNTQGSDFEA
ncbi:hypothetical protein RvY_12062 [Ramazzottius varieornatus]|uniref:Uncharacterized protein n=1 Tax=Ramazzottius varieornatus TaxID=947166 RepID=A0A1D1VI89_RAMVA|nr:hypothetical protein RvY_12062 [Ramazzottius varieornatus]